VQHGMENQEGKAMISSVASRILGMMSRDGRRLPVQKRVILLQPRLLCKSHEPAHHEPVKVGMGDARGRRPKRKTRC